MKRSVRTLVVGACLIAASLVCANPVPAQEASPTPVVIVGSTHFDPLFERVTLQPGERMDKDVDIGRFTAVSFLAAAEAAAPATGRVAVATIYGPPEVPVPNALNLGFNGGTMARGSDRQPVMGPHLIVRLANMTTQAVTVSLSLFASR